MLVSVCVKQTGVGKLLPWTIVSTANNNTSFEELFEALQLGNVNLVKVRVGTGTDPSTFSVVQDYQNISMKDIVELFGNYIEFSVENVQPKEEPMTFMLDDMMARARQQETGSEPTTSVLDDMMSRARQQAGNMPSKKPPLGRTPNRDKLYNSMVSLLESHSVTFPTDAEGVKYTQRLTEALFYIDGHQEAIHQRCPLPAMFSDYQGYNKPEASRHKRRSVEDLGSYELKRVVNNLRIDCLRHWTKAPEWEMLRKATEDLVVGLEDYATFLDRGTKCAKTHVATYTIDDKRIVQVIPQNDVAKPILDPLKQVLKDKDIYQYVDVTEYAPKDKVERGLFLKDLAQGLPFRTVLYTCSYGAKIIDHIFTWRVDDNDIAVLPRSQEIIQQLTKDMPTYYPKAMTAAFVRRFGSLTCQAPVCHLRSMFTELTNSPSALVNISEEELDVRINWALECEDPDLILDFHELNVDRQDRYTVFWENMEKYIEDTTAVDERLSDVGYMPVALSVQDLVGVKYRCPPGTAIPSEQWVRFQFHPRHPDMLGAADQYTCGFNPKMMVQQRQLHLEHPDRHYCAAYFKYLREFAVQYREVAVLMCVDNKHRIRVGEPGLPVSSAEPGKRVIVNKDQALKMADHDCTKVSLIPSVQLVVDIPDSIDGSFCDGEVSVILKDTADQPSSGLRNAVELYSTLVKTQNADKPILLIYTDGGPELNNTFTSNQTALVALHLLLNLDMTICMRTTPQHSWRNTVERVMAAINIGLQAIGIMRQEGSEELEQKLKKASNLSEVREVAKDMKEDYTESMKPCQELVGSVLERLVWSGKNMKTQQPATEGHLGVLWDEILNIDESFTNQKSLKKDLDKSDAVKKFFDHCCILRHYSFTIKKCGQASCTICRPVRMDEKTFSKLHSLPDPVPQEDGEHYRSFSDLYGQPTSETNRPSLHTAVKRWGSLSFSASAQHVKNADTVVHCEECGMVRVVYSKKKLGGRERRVLQDMLSSDNTSYICGATLDNLERPEVLKRHQIEVQHHTCGERVESLYYTNLDNNVICVRCSADMATKWNFKTASMYPKCENCTALPDVHIKGKRNTNGD